MTMKIVWYILRLQQTSAQLNQEYYALPSHLPVDDVGHEMLLQIRNCDQRG